MRGRKQKQQQKNGHESGALPLSFNSVCLILCSEVTSTFSLLHHFVRGLTDFLGRFFFFFFFKQCLQCMYICRVAYLQVAESVPFVIILDLTKPKFLPVPLICQESIIETPFAGVPKTPLNKVQSKQLLRALLRFARSQIALWLS